MYPNYRTTVKYTVYVTIGCKRQNRCGECPGCLSTDCNQCKFCLDKIKNGGLGLKKQCCIKRKCIRTAKAEADVADAISRLHSLRNTYCKDNVKHFYTMVIHVTVYIIYSFHSKAKCARKKRVSEKQGLLRYMTCIHVCTQCTHAMCVLHTISYILYRVTSDLAQYSWSHHMQSLLIFPYHHNMFDLQVGYTQHTRVNGAKLQASGLTRSSGSRQDSR